MAYEVEAKAWVDDWDAVEKFLRVSCTFERSFEKADRYYLFPGQASPGDERGASAFRLRTDGDHAYVTFKRKAMRDGTEYNFEREFGVDDSIAFLELVERLGCHEHFAKVKRGLHFSLDGLTAELVHLEGLGDFLEVEHVLESDDITEHERAAKRIRSLIERSGVPQERLETRPYMQMLREARSG